jgi:hypothetical protein
MTGKPVKCFRCPVDDALKMCSDDTALIEPVFSVDVPTTKHLAKHLVKVVGEDL